MRVTNQAARRGLKSTHESCTINRIGRVERRRVYVTPDVR